jgi:Fanconi-associated nuclease 1
VISSTSTPSELNPDPVTVFRPSLLRRLRTLEKKLKIPKVDRATVERELRTADVVSFSAVRLEKSSTSLHLGTNLQLLENGGDVRKYFSPVVAETDNAISVAGEENSPEVFVLFRDNTLRRHG